MAYTRVKNYLNGEWVEEKGVEYMPLYNPSTGEEIGEVPFSSNQSALLAIDSAHEAYRSWRKTPLGKRVDILIGIRQAMIEKEEELAFSIAIDQAKHISEARGEVRRVIEILEAACALPSLMQGDYMERIAASINARVVRQPLGVFGGVAPFNFPALVFGWFVPYAIGAGNAFIYKPSSLSPLFMQKMGEILSQLDLPGGVVNIIHGEKEIPESWYDQSKISGVCLVGSSGTAKKIAEACGRGGKRSMLLGGAKNYLLVMEDVNWDVFIDNFVHSCFGSAGQRCLAGSVVAAVPEVYDELIERTLEAAKKVKVGDALDPDVYMGPVISKEAKARIENYVEIGVEQGSKLLLDGRNPPVPEKNKNGYFVGPTIFADVTPCRRIAQEEIFGPLVSIMKVSDLQDGLDIIERQRFGNGACIFTQNQYYAETFITEANVGMVGVNVGVCAPHPYMPFGGIKDSLIGTNKVQGNEGLDFFTQNKIATVRTIAPQENSASGDQKIATSDVVRSCVAN